MARRTHAAPRLQAFAGVLLALGLCTTAAPGQTSTAVLRVMVRTAEGDSGIAGAVVHLENTPLSGVTDARGSRRFSGLASGRYNVSAVAIGFERGRPVPVDLVPGEEQTLDLSLRRAALDLPGVVVTAGGMAERPAESPASVAVLQGDEIARRNVVTVDQALRYVPGVIFNNADMDIRGATGVAGGVGSRVLLLLDGHPALTGDGGEIDFNALPMLDVDRVEVVKGAYSALYGSNALGGVVNLITTRIEDAPETVVRGYYGAYNVPRQFRFTSRTPEFAGLDAQHSRRIGPVGARVVASHEGSDGFKENGDLSRWFLRGKLASRPESQHPWDAYVLWSREDDGNFFQWAADTAPYTVPAAERLDWSRSVKLSPGGTITPVATGSMLLRITPTLAYNSIQNHFHDNKDYHRATRGGINVQSTFFPLRGHALTLGVDGAETRVVSNFLGRPYLTDLAAFAQDEIVLTSRLKVSAGGRLDYHKATGSASELSLSPKLGFAYRLSERLSVRTSIARGYRAPSAIEQFVSTTQSGFRVVPNPLLHGERAWSGEVGVTGIVSRRFRIDGALFESEYRDLIGPAPAPGQPFVFQFRNVSRARVRGLDVGARLSMWRERVDFEGTYTFLDSRDLDTGLPLPYRSRHNVTGSVSVLGGLAGLDWRFRSRVDQVLAFPLDRRGAISVLDLRLGYQILGTALLVKVANLLQSKYVDVEERNQGAPRSVMVTAFRAF